MHLASGCGPPAAASSVHASASPVRWRPRGAAFARSVPLAASDLERPCHLAAVLTLRDEQLQLVEARQFESGNLQVCGAQGVRHAFPPPHRGLAIPGVDLEEEMAL